MSAPNQATWPYRVLAILIALALWWVTVADKRELESDKVVDASVTYNTSKGAVVMNRVSQIKVLVRGSSREIRRLRPFDVDVLIDLPNAEAGWHNVNLTPHDVALPTDHLSVVSIEPKLIRVELDTLIEKSLPVEVELDGEPAAGLIVKSRQVVPSIVLVEGPSQLLGSIDVLATAKVSLEGHAFSFEKKVPVVTPDPAIRVLRPTLVSVRVTLELPPEGGERTP